MHVLREVVRVVEVDDALLVGLHHILGKQLAHREVLGDLACHVVALDGHDGGVLVGVLLLDLLVVRLDEAEDLVVRRVLLALLVLHVAVDDVLAGDGEAVEGHELVLDEVLDLLDGHGVAGVRALVLHVVGCELDLAVRELLVGGGLGVRGLDGVHDLLNVELDLGTVPLDDLHAVASRSSLCAHAHVIVVNGQLGARKCAPCDAPFAGGCCCVWCAELLCHNWWWCVCVENTRYGLLLCQSCRNS